MVPSVRQSSDTVHYGHITHQGSGYLRWIMVEAVHMHMRFDPGSSVSRFYRKIAKKKGKSRAIVASANKLLKIVYWVLKENRAYQKNQAQ